MEYIYLFTSDILFLAAKDNVIVEALSWLRAHVLSDALTFNSEAMVAAH